MRLYNNWSKQLCAITCLVIVATVFSCKKTEVIPYEKVQANTILEYKVTNSTDTLYGAIDNIKNTITLYIPYYVGIDHVVPDIKIAADAKLLDAAGNVINLDGGILPVPVDTTGYTYTVLGSDNSKRTYTLVLQIAPHPDALKVGYLIKTGTIQVNYDTAVTKPVYSRIPLYGNFGSTSANAKFTLTHQKTGKVYTDILKVYDVTPGTNYYTMTVDINANADSGYYNVEVKHQGRTAKLQPLHLIYQRPVYTNVKSTQAYAPGDTVVFPVKESGVNMGLERVYMRFWKDGFTYSGSYPSTFPASLFGQELDMKIVSSTRTEVKAIFPDVPDGAVGSYVYSITFSYPGIGFYFSYKDETGWGKNNMLATIGRLFTINPKK